MPFHHFLHQLQFLTVKVSIVAFFIGGALVLEAFLFSDSFGAPLAPELERCHGRYPDSVPELKNRLGEPLKIKSEVRGYWLYFEGPIVALVDKKRERVLLMGCRK